MQYKVGMLLIQSVRVLEADLKLLVFAPLRVNFLRFALSNFTHRPCFSGSLSPDERRPLSTPHIQKTCKNGSLLFYHDPDFIHCMYQPYLVLMAM